MQKPPLRRLRARPPKRPGGYIDSIPTPSLRSRRNRSPSFANRIAISRISCIIQLIMYNIAYMEEHTSQMSQNPIQVPAGEFQRHIGRYQDMALTQPVAVTRN